LLGESRSGKSTILSILSHLVGDANCSSVPLKDVKNSQHTPDLINKIVNIDYDVSVKAVEFEDEFKKITGGEPIRVNQKYVASFSFRPYCKLAMSANIFPKITDHSSAFYTRLMLIPCDRIFSDEEQNRDLPKQLIVELPGILNWVLEGLRRLKKRGKFEQLDFMRDAVEELENENNPTNLFFDDYIEVKADTVTYIDKGELYEHYKRWAERTKNYPLSAARFASCVFKRFHKVTPKNCRLQYGGKRIWRCLQYVEDKKQVGKPVDWAE
jgi:putative DNA primase/helicase